MGGRSSGGVTVPPGSDVHVTKETAGRPGGAVAGGTESTLAAAASLQDTATRVAGVEAQVRNLQKGVSTQGRWNTVSTAPAPSTTDGYPEGAWWTQVLSAADMTPQALWTVADGRWATRPLPANTVAPVMNTGLISAASIASAIIKSDEFWTALSGRRVGFNSAGFAAYDGDGRQTLRLDGENNFVRGSLSTGDAVLTRWVNPDGSSRSGVVFDDSGSGEAMDESKAAALPRFVASRNSGGTSDVLFSAGDQGGSNMTMGLSRQTGEAYMRYATGDGNYTRLTLRDGGGKSQLVDSRGRGSGVSFGQGYMSILGVLDANPGHSMFRWGVQHVGHMHAGMVQHGEQRLFNTGGEKWLPILVPYDWSDGAALAVKVTSADADRFRVSLECTAGSTDQAGFFWLAVRVGNF